MTKLTSLAPVLLVEDVREATDYYRDKLGFEVDQYERIPEHYADASRDGCSVHFACFEGAPPRPNVEVFPPDMFDVYFNVDHALHAELLEQGADLLHAPVRQGYGMYEFRVCDPHGYILAFGS
jgi:catechol 2,3-dioxygenase-like lactoylglutathione lyase family enzyme